MIRVFHRIRSNLFNTNNFGRYILYAIGEIILVVIGILLALQINNWNENKKNKIEENRALKQIISDLNREKQVLVSSIESMKQSRAYLKEVLFDARTENLDSIFMHLCSIFNYYPLNSEYINLKYSGNLNLISNNMVRNHIVTYYEIYHRNYDFVKIEHLKFANNQVEEYFREEFPGDTIYLYNPEIVKTKLKDEKFRKIIMEQIGNYDFITHSIDTSVIDNLVSWIARDTL